MLCPPHFRLCGHCNTCNTQRIALFWCIDGSDVPALGCLRCEACSPVLHSALSAGFGSLYNGLSAGLLRQATYTTARLGIFQVINAEAIKMNEGKPLPLYQKALCGLTAGGLGALVGTPADLTLIRMQAGVKATFVDILLSWHWSCEFVQLSTIHDIPWEVILCTAPSLLPSRRQTASLFRTQRGHTVAVDPFSTPITVQCCPRPQSNTFCTVIDLHHASTSEHRALVAGPSRMPHHHSRRQSPPS